MFDKSGNWHHVLCHHGILGFNVREMLQEATKRYYKSTTHRIINPVSEVGQKSPYPLPLFCIPEMQYNYRKLIGQRVSLLNALEKMDSSSLIKQLKFKGE